MLYDKRWDKEIKAKPLTLPSLIAWLEMQPADGRYCTLPMETCLLGKFAAAMGAKDLGDTSCLLGNNKNFANVAFPIDGSMTFGAALKRARAQLTAHD